MIPCPRVGLDVTARCNCKCVFCFYRWEPPKPEPTWKELTEKVDRAIAGGLTQAVLVGYGEPSLGALTQRILDYCHERGMATSMITNGTTGLKRFQAFYDQGIDHLHISSHGIGTTLDAVLQCQGAFHRQAELKTWLIAENLPWRNNVTLQQANYRELPEIARYEIRHGIVHFVFLNLIPIYGWSAEKGRVQDIAVHPAQLRPYMVKAIDILFEAGVLVTIRDFPFCHLPPRYWPHITNARYVFASPFEWNYELQVQNPERLFSASFAIGDGMAVNGAPCNQCLARRHCGGFNAKYAEAFDGADLTPIPEVPEEYRDVWDVDGGIHDLNPVNQHSGILRKTDV